MTGHGITAHAFWTLGGAGLSFLLVKLMPSPPSSIAALPANRVVEVLAADRLVDDHFAPGSEPAGGASLNGACAGVIVFGQKRQARDAAEHREGRDRAGASERPCGSQSELAGGKTRLDALADVKAGEHVLVRIQFDRGAADHGRETSARSCGHRGRETSG